MSKNFNIILFVFLFIFALSIDSFPRPNALFKKREEPVGKFLQCPGEFPITYSEITYTPAVFEPGKNITEHVVGKSTVSIEEGSVAVLNVYLKNELVYTNKTDYCQAVKKYNMTCPIAPDSFDVTFTFPVKSSPNDPKGQTVDYLVNYLRKSCSISLITNFFYSSVNTY